MEVAVLMNRNVRLCSPRQSVRQAAILMREIDVGSLPVSENDRLIGMITDRDIAVRAVAAGKGGEIPIREIMSESVIFCYETDNIADVATKMSDLRVRRLPVLNDAKRLVGIISLSDISIGDERCAGAALSGMVDVAGQARS